MAVSVPIEPMRLDPGPGHGAEDEPQLLVGVAEEALATDHRGVLGGEHGAGRQVVEVDLAGLQPLGVGVLGGQGVLDLVVVDDPARRRCRPGTSARAGGGPCAPPWPGGTSRTPTSLASTTRPSSVTQ